MHAELIESLSTRTYNDVVDSLNVDDRWLTLAISLRCYRLRIEFSCDELQKWRKTDSPSTKLLQELTNRCCPIIVFKEMLRAANLLETLAIIHEPEPLCIVRQPAGDVDCRRHQELGEKCQHVHRDGELTLECWATGLPPPKYQWHRNNSVLEGFTLPILKVPNFTLEDEGEYWCQVSQLTKEGKEETLQSDFVDCKVIHVLPRLSKPFWVTDQSVEHAVEKTVEPGKAFRIGVALECDPPCKLQWHKDNVILNLRNSQILEITNAAVEDSGRYFFTASNEAGDVASSSIKIRVEYPHPRPTNKVALVIANSTYDSCDDLMTPTNDILLLADHLRKVDFEVIAVINLTMEEMKKAIDEFFKLLSPGSYAVFCFIGHGFHYNKRDYMMPVDCTLPDDDQPLDPASVICDDILEKKAIQLRLGLFVMIADMCRRKHRCSIRLDESVEEDDCEPTAASQPHIMKLYSASENQNAYEVNGRKNGIYIPNLCAHLFQDKPIYDAVGDANRSFQNNPVAKRQTPAMRAQGINSMKLTDVAVQKVPVVLKSYPIHLYPDLNRPFPLRICPHRGCISNAVDVTFPRLQLPFDIKFELPEGITCCEMPTEDLPPGTSGITIYNVQKAKGAFPVYVCLSDGKTAEPRRQRVQLCDVPDGTLIGPARDIIF